MFYSISAIVAAMLTATLHHSPSMCVGGCYPQHKLSQTPWSTGRLHLDHQTELSFRGTVQYDGMAGAAMLTATLHRRSRAHLCSLMVATLVL